VDRSQCRVAAHHQSLHVGFAAVHHKTIGLLGLGTKPRPEARRAEMGSGHAKMLRSGGHASGSQGYVKAKRGAVTGHPSDGATMRIPKVLLEGVYPSIM
jgi:hypothetical protein